MTVRFTRLRAPSEELLMFAVLPGCRYIQSGLQPSQRTRGTRSWAVILETYRGNDERGNRYDALLARGHGRLCARAMPTAPIVI
jgi:hypothetical protein